MISHFAAFSEFILLPLITACMFQFNVARMFSDGMPGTFSVNYKCFSVSMMPGQDRMDVEKGGKSKLYLNFNFVGFLVLFLILFILTPLKFLFVF